MHADKTQDKRQVKCSLIVFRATYECALHREI